MSKLTKLINNPKLFFTDAIVKRKKWSFINKVKFPKRTQDVSKVLDITKKTKDINIQLSDEDLQILLAKFESSFPITEIYLRNYRAWFLLKYAIFHMLKNGNRLAYQSYLNYDKCCTLACSHNVVVDISDLNVSSDGVDDLFFCSEYDQYEVKNNIYYDVTIDPIYTELSQLRKTIKILMIDEYQKKELSVKFYAKPEFISTSHIKLIGGGQELKYPPTFVKHINGTFKLSISEKDIEMLVDNYLTLKERYKCIFQKYNPKRVFYTNWEKNTAIADAAAELGIISIAVSNIKNNQRMTWRNFPYQGYKGLPHHLLVNNQQDEIKILDEFKGSIKAINVGAYWLDSINVDMMTADELSIQETIECLKKQYKFIILITLENQSSLPKELEVAMKQYDDIAWLVLKNPKSDRFESSCFIGNKNITFLSIDDTYNLQVNILLKNVNFHITRSSETIYAANFYNVPSFVYGNGLIKFKDKIDDGVVYSLDNLITILISFEPYIGLDQFVSDYKSRPEQNELLSVSNINKILAI